ncbi:MAG: 50S ribosomal protein L31 [Bacilli bacterium]
MKANIHPEVKDATVTCACGATFQTKSTKEKIDIEICSECHPFYTGTQGKTKKTGNIEKFNKKFGLDKEQN